MGTRALVMVSTVQLAAGVAGQLVALRDGRAFDVALLRWRGRPEHVGRDSWLLGTGLSAPVSMLATQAVATARLAAAPGPREARVLAALGAMMTAGYLVEQQFRDLVRPRGWDREVTPVAVVGFALSPAMAALGLRAAAELTRRRATPA